MVSRRVLTVTWLLLVTLCETGLPQSVVSNNGRFALQVSAFPDESGAEECVADLVRGGESPIWGSVYLPERGNWFRVYIGYFDTAVAARSYGNRLLARRLIRSYIVKPASELKQLSRPRNVVREDGSPESLLLKRARGTVQLPSGNPLNFRSVCSIDPTLVPLPDPVRTAFTRFALRADQQTSIGGLWVSGDRPEALSRLQWIVGEENASLITLDAEGRVLIDMALLGEMAGAPERGPATWLRVSDYVASNNGLLLLAQLTQSAHRYLLHIGKRTRTPGGEVVVEGSINLDNNFDSRINPYRAAGKKLDRERPPEPFDSLIAINPDARWFNLRLGRLVPCGNITFHELAEAHAKVELRMQYLERDGLPGAHDVAIEREMQLRTERPLEDNVITMGANRVFRSDEEVRRFKHEFRLTSGGQD